MQIYKRVLTLTTNGGTGSASTLPIVGGLMRQLYVSASTATTAFRADVTDEGNVIVRSYMHHRGEINDVNNPLPVQGTYTIRVLEASADGPFTVLMMVQE